MDSYEATRIIFSRIQVLEPENVSKIMGYLLLQDHGEQEMIRLAFSPDTLIQSLIVKAKKDLGLVQQQQQQQQGSANVQSYLSRITRQNLTIQPPQISHSSSRLFSSSPTTLSPHAAPWGSHTQTRNLHVIPTDVNSNTITASSVSTSPTSNGYLNYSLQGQANKLPLIYNMDHPRIADSEFQLQDQISYVNDSCSESPNSHSHGNYLSYSEMLPYYNGNISPTANNNCNGVISNRPSSIMEMCNMSNSDPVGLTSTSAWKPCMYFARGYCKNGSNCRFLHSDYTEDMIGSSNGTLEKLELELQELLRGRRSPIISLPQLYGERLGKSLDIQRYRSERDYDRFTPASSGSRQIYLTFPAESTFKEEDVSNYFNLFGPVQDVRIPYQQKRMFGFVTFQHQETVKIILAKGNPHYVCDARVLVKPYREKGSIKPADRKYSGYLTTQHQDTRDFNLSLHIGPSRLIESNTDAMRRQLEEDEIEKAIELQARRLSELQLVDRQGASNISITPINSTAKCQENQFSNGPAFHSEEDSTASEDISSSTLADHFAYLLQVLDSEPNYEEQLPKPIDHHKDRCLVANSAMRM